MLSSNTQALSLSFKVPRRNPTLLQIQLRPNDDPAKTGYHLIFPDAPLSAFLGFPVCSAKIHASHDIGYAAIYGWIQFTRERPSVTVPGKWEMDPIPLASTLNTPFAWFGPEPQLFDAPSRLERKDIDWTAWSFLAYAEDSLMTKAVRPILGFEWGFGIEKGEVSIKSLKTLDVHQAWQQQRALLDSKFKGWRFDELDPDVRVEVLDP